MIEKPMTQSKQKTLDANKQSTKKKPYILEEDIRPFLEKLLQRIYSSEQIEQLAAKVLNEQLKQVYEGVIGLRKLSSSQYNAVDSLIKSNEMLRQKLLALCDQDDKPQLKMQATWLLTNFLGGPTDQFQLIIQPIYPILIRSLKRCRRKQIIQQVIWALGNISGEGPMYRDMLIQQGAHNIIVHIAQYFYQDQYLGNFCWTLSNICRGESLPQRRVIIKAISFIIKVISEQKIRKEEGDILSDCLWSILRNTNKIEDVQHLMDQKLLKSIFYYMEGTEQLKIIVPSLRIMLKISEGTLSQRRALARHHQFIKKLQNFLNHQKVSVRKVAVCIFVGLSLCFKEYNEKILSFEIMRKLLQMSMNDNEQVGQRIPLIFYNVGIRLSASQAHQFFKKHISIPNFFPSFQPTNIVNAKNIFTMLKTMLNVETKLQNLTNKPILQAIKNQQNLVQSLVQKIEEAGQNADTQVEQFYKALEQCEKKI